MIRWFRVANFTIRPHNALGGMMYLEISSKLNRKRGEPRFCGEGKRGRSPTLESTGDDSADAVKREIDASCSELKGVGVEVVGDVVK